MAHASDPADGRSDDGDDRRTIEALVDALTVAEKLRLVRGSVPEPGATAADVDGYLPPIGRLDIPALRFGDGPLGVTASSGTAFPAQIALGASFDDELAETAGAAMGAEARAAGVDVLLAPGCNIVRVPTGGRAFECFGEDPHHSGRLASATIRGIQSRGVVATPKHYVANNQETDRVDVSAAVDERPLRELYLPAFERAVGDADAGAVMAAYNRVNGTDAAEHRRLLTDVLKAEFGFDGPVVSDWWAVDDGPRAASAGLDLEMPGVGAIERAAMLDERLRPLRSLDRRWPDAIPGPEAAVTWLFDRTRTDGAHAGPRRSVFERTLPRALERDAVPTERLDDMVRRVLTLHDRVGALDGEGQPVAAGRTGHREFARRVAIRGSVLLKNEDGTLPLDRDADLAVIGPHVDAAKTGGGGSSAVSPATTVSPIEGIGARATGRVRVERGHPPVESRLPLGVDRSAIPRIGSDPHVRLDAARSAAADADAAVIVVQDDATEGRDRPSLSLPGRQNALIEAVAEAAARTVVVLQTAGPVETPWLEGVEAVVEGWYPGQEAGDAIAAVLYGDADPGGRLPVTFAASGTYPTTAPSRYPGVEGADSYPVATYGEGVFVGYRYLDERDLEPRFPFGHGLSYATFEYEEVRASLDGEPSVSVTVRNAAPRRGREVVQLYVRDPVASVPRPPRELAGFEAIGLDAGETRTVEVELADRAFAYYDPAAGEWTVESGEFVVELGRSSREPVAAISVEA